MDILKYLDVLIGLAVVMILLSPLVAAITQLWIWLSNMRAGRLQVALKQLILQLNGNPYEGFETAEISGVPANTTVTLDGINATAGATGVVTFANNIPGLLRAGNGTLTPTFAPPFGASPIVTLRARGPVGDWDIAGPASDANGVAILKYSFPGPAQFASWRAECSLPAGMGLSARIASGTLTGTSLRVVTAGATAGQRATVEYPPNARPVPSSHDVEIATTDSTTHAGVANQQITLRFERNSSFDRQAPLPAPALLAEKQATEIARAVLLHPMIARPPFLRMHWKKRMRGDVIEREELIRTLLELAAEEGPAGAELDSDTRAALRRTLAANDLTDPGQALAGIRREAQQLEKNQPDAAAHARLTVAILAAAPSAFVGKINNWFDQAMDRTTAEYKFRAQIITVIAAAIVAGAVQMDSIDLLKRLSTDDKLRSSLVEQGKEQQKRMDELAKTTVTGQNADRIQHEAELAKVRREEIETNLAKLRDPSMAILPDHFIWQPLPQARLARDPAWAGPKWLRPRRLELVVGASTYVIEPRWTDDPLADMRDAIASSGAPVTARLERPHEALIKKTPIEQIQVKADGVNRVKPDAEFAQATLATTPRDNEQLHLIAGYAPPVAIKAGKRGDIKTPIEKVKAETRETGKAGEKATIEVSIDATGRVLTATIPETRWIELLTDVNDSRTNILKPTEFVSTTGRVKQAWLAEAKSCELSVGGPPGDPVLCEVTAVVNELRRRGVEAETRDHLVLMSHRNPPLQVRVVPGRPESDILDRTSELKCPGWGLRDLPVVGPYAPAACFDLAMLRQSWLGLVVTWMLLSLGAPFWYDALKDLLKLRSPVASKEEIARNDRQKDTSKSAPTK